MRVSIIIPAAGTREELKSCLRPLGSSRETPQIIVVDDSKDQSLAAYAREFGRGNVVVLANGENRGASYSRNKGVAAATAEYLLFIDSDCRLEDDFLSRLSAAGSLLARPEVGGLSFTVTGPHGIFSQGIKIDFLFRAHNLRRLPSDITEVECLNTCCCLMKKDLFAQRGFREHYNYIFEDVEFSLYARRQGYRFYYYPACRAYHAGNSFPATQKQKMFYSYRNRLHALLSLQPKQRNAIVARSLVYEILRSLKLLILDPRLLTRALKDIWRARERNPFYR